MNYGDIIELVNREVSRSLRRLIGRESCPVCDAHPLLRITVPDSTGECPEEFLKCLNCGGRFKITLQKADAK